MLRVVRAHEVAGASGSGVSLSYNLAGERKSATYANDGHTESYDFDATGHLTNTYITLKGASSRYLAAARSNDLLGRMTGYTEYNADGSQKFWRTSTYDADSRVIAQNGSDGSTTYNFYASKTATGADNTANVSQSGFGEVAKVVTVGTGPSNNTTTTTTWTSYQYWDDAKEMGKTISGYNPVLEGNNGQWAPGVSSLKYDVNGHLVSATDAGKDGTVGTADDIRFAYIENAQGVVLRRDQYYGSSVAKTHSYYYLNGQAVGDVGNDGDTLKDYAQTLSQAKVSKEQSYKNWTPISSADFDQNWQPVGPSYPGDAAGTYTVKAGDTLQSIAQSIWGDASLWYILADANGVSGSTALKAGQLLSLPNRITNIHNNSTTFRPYNAGRVIGDTSPTLPDAPPAPVHDSGGGGCGGGGILVAIVVVAVAVITEQYELIPEALQGGASEAMYVAAVSNVAGQATANAVGMQSGFDWTSLAVSVGTAGIMEGLSSTLGTNAVLNAAAANAVNQGLNMALGRQNGFNWTSLAISAVSTAVAEQISKGLTGQGGSFADADALTKTAVNSTTHALVSAVTRLSIQGGKLDWEAVAADTIYGMKNGFKQTDTKIMGTTGADGQQASSDQSQERVANAQEELRFKLGEGVAQVNQGNSLNGQANEVYSAMLDAFQNVSAQTSAIGAGTLYAQNTLTDPTNPLTMTDAGGVANDKPIPTPRFASTANKDTVSPYSLNILNNIAEDAGISTEKILITSTLRTPADQARIMLDQLETGTISRYGSAGRDVISIYNDGKDNGFSTDQILQSMTNKITEYLNNDIRVSNHLGDPSSLNVFDIAPSSIPASKHSNFEAALNAAVQRGDISIYHGPNTAVRDPAYHLEIRQPKK